MIVACEHIFSGEVLPSVPAALCDLAAFPDRWDVFGFTSPCAVFAL